MIWDTSSLDNAYHKFGNVAKVDHWFKAKCFTLEMRVATGPGKSIKINGKPDWWQPPFRVDGFKLPHLLMSAKLDACLIMRNKSYPNINPSIALELEKIARKKPKHDWRVELISAFESLTYQRQGRNKWVLIEVGKGYA
jgi:hypothetical protein